MPRALIARMAGRAGQNSPARAELVLAKGYEDQPQPGVFFTAPEVTVEFLASDQPRLYLYGSFEGYSNFGDTLQLKGAIAFHRGVGSPEPVVVLPIDSLINEAHVESFRKWFGVQHVLFVALEALDATAVGLNPVRSIHRGGQLHLYGGGYLNEMWASHRYSVLDFFFGDLGVTEYVLSGHQIDETVVPRLEAMFRAHPPRLVGLRDRQSQALLASGSAAGVVRFSFDDVTEVVQAWMMHIGPPVAPNGTEIALHMNITGEYTGGQRQVAVSEGVLRRQLEIDPKSELALLHAYDDRRQLVRDTLAALKEFDAFFPFDEFRVVNLARMALEIDMESGLFPGGSETFRISFGLVSSYHTALVLHLMGIPAYLLSLNDYYRQKAAIFNLPAAPATFLAAPEKYLRDFSPELADREAWVSELTAVVASWRDSLGGEGVATLRWPEGGKEAIRRFDGKP